jgi:peroxiredoxin
VESPHDPARLPSDLPRPAPDGETDHLPGSAMPSVALPSTSGDLMSVNLVPQGFERLVIYAYPLTGLPGVDPPLGWDEIPGARGCTPESCGFRDHATELAAEGTAVVGLSIQSTNYQREAAQRLRLPFPLLSDVDLRLTHELKLPTFIVQLRPQHDGGGRRTLLKRLTLLVRDGSIEKVFYPVFPPDRHAEEVLMWVRSRISS